MADGPPPRAPLPPTETGETQIAPNVRARNELLESFGRFRIVRTLGAGGYGIVYLAHDPQLDRAVALKVPLAAKGGDPSFLERFRREGRSAAQLRHPGIVAIHSVEQEKGVPFIVYEYVEGPTLADYIQRNAPTFRQSAEIVRDVARALDFAHAARVVHRDVKPANILLDRSGSPRLTDFGLAKRIHTDITMTLDDQVMGTPAFMPPEQALGDHDAVGPRSDVYSLGVVLYVMLTGEIPFRGKAAMVIQQVIHDDPRNARSMNDRVSIDLDTICQKAMEKEPHCRYHTAGEFADDLDRWLQGRPIHARHISTTGKVLRWTGRNRLTAGLITMIVSLVITVTSGSLYLFMREYWAVSESSTCSMRNMSPAPRPILNLNTPRLSQYSGCAPLVDGRAGNGWSQSGSGMDRPNPPGFYVAQHPPHHTNAFCGGSD